MVCPMLPSDKAVETGPMLAKSGAHPQQMSSMKVASSFLMRVSGVESCKVVQSVHYEYRRIPRLSTIRFFLAFIMFYRSLRFF